MDMNNLKNVSIAFKSNCELCLSVSILMFSALFISQAIGEANNDNYSSWERFRSENGITGYEREVDDSKYIESRSETLIEAPIETILEVLNDVSSYPKWMHKCKESIELKASADVSSLLYFAQGVPLGSPDRDVIIERRNLADWDMGSYEIILKAENNHSFQHPDAEIRKKRVRMTDLKGKWVLRLINRNQTQVTYTIFTDPGGFAPGFIVNGMMRDVSFLTLKGLTSMVKESRYIEAASSGHAKQQIEANWRDIDG